MQAEAAPARESARALVQGSARASVLGPERARELVLVPQWVPAPASARLAI